MRARDGILVAALVLAACDDEAPSAVAGSTAVDSGVSWDGAVTSTAPDASATVPRWEVRSPLPEPIQETAVVALRGRVWVIGGLTKEGTSSRTVHVYDPAADAWATTAPLPVALHHANAAVVGDRLFVVGSLMGAGFAADGSTFAYDPDANAWAPRARMPVGTERGSSMIGVVGTRIVVAGGLRGGNAVADVSAYDTASDAWVALPSLPAPRDHGVGAAYGTIVLAIGGRAASLAGHTSRVDALDLAAAEPAWTPRAPMPTSRAGAAIAASPSGLVVLGGEGNAASPIGMFDEVERYDPASDAWTALPRLPSPRHGTGAATVGDVVVVPGGGDRQGLAPVAAVDALRL